MREVRATKTRTGETTVTGRRRREVRVALSLATTVLVAQAISALQARGASASCRQVAAPLRSQKAPTKVCGILRHSLATTLEGPSLLSEVHLRMRANGVITVVSRAKAVSNRAIAPSSRPNGP